VLEVRKNVKSFPCGFSFCVYAMSCSVKGCGNYFRKTKLLNGNSIKYFSFPKDSTIAAKWLAACGKQNNNLKESKIFFLLMFVNAKYHGSKFKKDKFIFKKLADKIEIMLKPIKLPREVLLCLVRTRTYIRVRIINHKITVKNRFKNKKKKLIKFTNNKFFS